MLNIEYIRPLGCLKLTVQNNGRLGFSHFTSNTLDIQNNKYCIFGKSKDDDKLYFLLKKEKNIYTHKISRSGEIFYTNAIAFLNEVGVEYTRTDIKTIFELHKVDKEESTYELVKRVIVKKNYS